MRTWRGLGAVVGGLWPAALVLAAPAARARGPVGAARPGRRGAPRRLGAGRPPPPRRGRGGGGGRGRQGRGGGAGWLRPARHPGGGGGRVLLHLLHHKNTRLTPIPAF